MGAGEGAIRAETGSSPLVCLQRHDVAVHGVSKWGHAEAGEDSYSVVDYSRTAGRDSGNHHHLRRRCYVVGTKGGDTRDSPEDSKPVEDVAASVFDTNHTGEVFGDGN